MRGADDEITLSTAPIVEDETDVVDTLVGIIGELNMLIIFSLESRWAAFAAVEVETKVGGFSR